MYHREIQDTKPSPVLNGKIIPGTWNRAFDDINLLAIKKAYPVPLPKWLKNYRIKEWQSFHVQDENYYLYAVLSNAKYYRVAQVVLYDKESKEKLIFRKALPFGAWKLPRSLYNSAIASSSYGFFFRIHNWLDADLLELDLDIEATRKRPSFTAHLEFDLTRSSAVPLVVCLPFSDKQCMYAHKVLSPVKGDLVFGGKHISMEQNTTSGFFYDYKGSYPYRMRNSWCSGFGIDLDGRRYGFSVAENQARESYKNNENGFWLDGETSPLPPVKITMSSGPESDWVIQDLEGMVDLTFTPREHLHASFDLLLTRADYYYPFGVFNGMVMTSSGEKINIRNLHGLCEKLYLRV